MRRPRLYSLIYAVIGTFVFFFLTGALSSAEVGERVAGAAARESIRTTDLKRHIEILADDSFEGREAGSRGGRAAGLYLAREFERHKLTPAGGDGTYFQTFHGNCRNVLGLVKGSNPALSQQYVVVCAHYDHVGYGSRRNSNGPIGYIHNGADDNASGVAALLEVVEAIVSLDEPPARSILFALWDSEENGLNGSQHWTSNSTVPLAQVTTAINLDMVGRLRSDRLTVYGTRTRNGLRRIICEANREANLLLDFSWEMSRDSDHYTFFTSGIPVLMFHTGLHEDYHRPSDDPARINNEGIQRVTKLLFGALLVLADEPVHHRFRPQSREEFPSTRQSREVALSPLPGRLGVRWRQEPTVAEPGVLLESVTPSSAAHRADLRVGDRITHIAGQEVYHDSFASQVLAAVNPVEVLVRRPSKDEPLTVKLELSGQPVRVGIAWRVDDAEPTLVQVIRVLPASPAAVAGIRVFDRIYRVNGQQFSSSDEFGQLLRSTDERLQLLVEASGRLRTVDVTPFRTDQSP